MKVSSSELIEIAVFESRKVLAPISSVKSIMTQITLNSKNLFF
ncbi:MAG: hypothetical protein ACJASU_001281 [Cognaticolwellia sp.]|jgi:hypothetical protein